MNHYAVFGIGINSELILPELSLSGKKTDVFIRISADDFVDPEKKQHPYHKEYRREEAIVAFDGVGSYRIRRGTDIDIWKVPHADDRLIRMFLHGIVSAILLHQRGLLVLHGSCMDIHGRTAGFLGPSGAGKSTIAASLNRRGADIVAEDIVAIDYSDGTPVVYPGIPQLKMAPNVATCLNYSAQSIESLYPLSDEVVYRYDRKLLSECLNLNCIFVISDAERINISALSSAEGLIELVRNSYTARILERTQSQESHFKNCTQLLRKIPVFRLERPRNLALLQEVAAVVEEFVMNL